MSSDYEVIKEIEKQTGVEFERVSRDSFDEFTLKAVWKYIHKHSKHHICIENNNKIIGFVNIGIQLNIKHLQILRSLKLLILYESQLNDISYLETFNNLTHLLLLDTQIKDCTSLKKLNNLTELVLNRNNIDDISFVENLSSLTILHLGFNEINNISFMG